MNTKNNNINKPLKLAFLTAIASFVGGYVWMILLHIGVQIHQIKKLGSIALGKAASEELFKHNVTLISISYVVMEVVMLLIACLVVKKFKKDKLTLEDIGMKKYPGSLKKFAIGFIASMILYPISFAVMYGLGIVKFTGYGFSSQSMLNGIATAALMLFLTVFPGVCEEIIYRGIVQKYLAEKMNLPLSILISSVLFAVLHIGKFQLLHIAAVIIIGAAFGYIYAETKSLYFTIGIHFAWDFMCYIIAIGKTSFDTNPLLIFEYVKSTGITFEFIEMLSFVVLAFLIFAKHRINKVKNA